MDEYIGDEVGDMVCMVQGGLREAVEKGKNSITAEELKACRREIDEY